MAMCMVTVLLLSAVAVSTVAAFQRIQLKQPLRGDLNGIGRNLDHVHRTKGHTKFASPASNAVGGQVVNIDETAPREIYAMDEWATSCGVQRSDGFQLTLTSQDVCDNGDVSVMTTVDVPANAPVLFVPNHVVISSAKSIQEFGRLEEAEKFLYSLNAADELGYFYLMIKILVEYEKGDESPWYPWLNALPRYYSNGASMTPLCFECLPPLAASLAMTERTKLMSLKNVKHVPFLSEETKTDPNLVKWAFQIAYTRSFEVQHIGDNGVEESHDVDLCIVPMADMFNHGTDPEVAFGFDEQGNYYAQTTRDVPAGSPLRISYGDPTNPSYLFARYGFVDESSPATFCKIMIPHTNSQLEDIGYAHNRMLFYKDTGDVSEEVWDVLLYQILSSSNAARRREFYDAHMKGDFETKRYFHEQYYPETSAKLLNHVDSFLNQLDDLSAKSYGKDTKEHPRLPVILKHNEFVRNTFLAVRSRYFQ